jgi:hypothetical protein
LDRIKENLASLRQVHECAKLQDEVNRLVLVLGEDSLDFKLMLNDAAKKVIDHMEMMNEVLSSQKLLFLE